MQAHALQGLALEEICWRTRGNRAPCGGQASSPDELSLAWRGWGCGTLHVLPDKPALLPSPGVLKSPRKQCY